MDNFLKTTEGFENTLKLIETINRSTDDYLFIWDIQADTRWFFGDIDTYYDIRKDGSATNSTADMMRIIHPADRAAVLKSLEQVVKGEKDIHDMDYRWINRDGQKVWINCHGTVIRDANQQAHLMIGRVSEENLRHLYNPLTALWNKNKLRQDLKLRLAKGGGYLMYLDVDGLAAINLTHGRAYGDQLLKDIAEYLENLPQVEAAYHIDHNYFALVLRCSAEEEVQTLFNELRQNMMEKCSFTAGAVPIDKASFMDETQLIDSITVTLKKAQKTSQNRLEFFSASALRQRIASLELLEEIKQSIENSFEGFSLLYQPQVRAGTYEIYGVEALLRYRSNLRGTVFPDEFIPVLEQSRLIKVVGLWVLEQALAQCRHWRKTLPDLHVSVNFSALQFEDALLGEQVVKRIKAAGLPGDALTVELTESMELHNSAQLINTIAFLKEYGINFAIDDFGTGYSNLGYLKQLQVDEIKIDRVFISGLERETYNHKLISNIIEFGKVNAIRTCCEGVESPQELATLEALLPDMIQGYLFDKPTTPDVIERRYMDQTAPEYQDRLAFIAKIFELREKLGIIHFDPKDILRENGVGLWVMRLNHAIRHYELHMDKIMEQLIGADPNASAREWFKYYISKIHPDHAKLVDDGLQEMIRGPKSVQMEFVWQHPTTGDMWLRFSGKRVEDSNGMIVLQGYCRSITGKEQSR